MAWIEVHQSLFTHRKTLQLAEWLDLPEVYVAGHLIALWSWALDNAPDGILPESERIIARGAQYGGDPQHFVEGLRACGFLENSWTIHDWHDYAGKLLERRRRNTEAVRALRNRQSQRVPANRNDDVIVTSEATVPNRTKPNPTVPDPRVTDAPAQAQGTERPRSAPKPRATRLPDPYPLPNDVRQWAERSVPGLDVEYEHEKFCDYWHSAPAARTDWVAAERNWLRRAYESAPRARMPGLANGRASPAPPTRAQQREQQILAEREKALRAIDGYS